MPLHTESKSSVEESVSYSHVQLYVDRVEDLSVYKALENQLNTFSNKVQNEDLPRLEQKKKLWQTLVMPETSSSFTTERTFCPQNRDVVQQLLSGFGFRVTGARYDDDDDTETCSTRSVLVTSRDPAGVQILVTAAADAAKPTGESTSDKPLTTAGIFNAGEPLLFVPFVVVVPARFLLILTISSVLFKHMQNTDKVRRFMDAHRGRQGVGVLAFAVENVEIIKERYEQRHPSLVDSYEEIPGGHKVLEVFACYQRHDDDGETSEQVADCGTILRFVQFSSESSSSLSTNHDSTAPSCTMLGLTPVDAVFEESSMSAYCDHWVSNVFDRTEFLETLEDTLGFTPKVDFNAGVVAAGEAQIESTVTGNTSTNVTADKEAALRDQSQVYLPINNALSSVGHVHGFLQEVGQGVQHVASRVENLVEFVQHGNEYREITGEGASIARDTRRSTILLSVHCSILTTLFLSKQGFLFFVSQDLTMEF